MGTDFAALIGKKDRFGAIGFRAFELEVAAANFPGDLSFPRKLQQKTRLIPRLSNK